MLHKIFVILMACALGACSSTEGIQEEPQDPCDIKNLAGWVKVNHLRKDGETIISASNAMFHVDYRLNIEYAGAKESHLLLRRDTIEVPFVTVGGKEPTFSLECYNTPAKQGSGNSYFRYVKGYKQLSPCNNVFNTTLHVERLLDNKGLKFKTEWVALAGQCKNHWIQLEKGATYRLKYY